MDSMSISNTISKASAMENFSIYEAYRADAISRLAEREQTEAISNERIRKDDEILETYRVEDDAIHGGMGSVWRVHHKSWNTDLAMKRPQPRFFAEGSERRKAAFIAECEHWIDLGLHPGIVSCYYVREIGGVPTVFSEWMDGGSLKDAIRTGRLYDGTETEVQERILDIAIQAARGLRYSHERGLIHQDIKPGNLLLSKDWEAKVADFGLAKAYSDPDKGKTSGSFAGYTPEYCPEEQANGEEPASWMDVYALMLTLVEMYAGKRLWESGADAFPRIIEVLDRPEPVFRVTPPEKLADLLREECVSSGRWTKDLLMIEKILLELYREMTGNSYPRKDHHSAESNAGLLNNKALSYIDLGAPETAERHFLDALRHDPLHSDTVYNYNLFRWRRGLITDDAAVAEMRKVWELDPTEETAMHLARMEMEREDPESAEAVLKQAEQTQNVRELAREIEEIKKNRESRIRQPLAVKMRQNGIMSRKQDAVWVADKRNGVLLKDMDGKILRHLPQLRRIDGVSEDDRLVAVFENCGTIRESCNAATAYCCSVYDALSGTKKCSVDKGLGDRNSKLFFLDGGRLLAVHGAMEYLAGYNEDHDEDIYEKTTEEDVRVYDLTSGEKLYSLLWTYERKCFAAGGRWLADAYEIRENDGGVRRSLMLYDALTGKKLKELEGNPESRPVDKAFFSTGADKLYTLSRDGLMCVYSIPEGRIILHKQVHDPGFESRELMVCENGRLVSGDRNDRFRFFNESGRCVRSGPNGNNLWDAVPAGLAPSGNYWCSETDHMLRAWQFPVNDPVAPWSLTRIQSTREVLDSAEQFRLLMEKAKEARILRRFGEAFSLCLQARQLPGYENAQEARNLCLDIGLYGTRTTLRLVHRRSEYKPDTDYTEGALYFGKGGRCLFYDLGAAVCRLDVVKDALIQAFHTRPRDELIRNTAIIPYTGQLFCQTDKGACVIRPGNGDVVRQLDKCLAAPEGTGHPCACAVSRNSRYAAVLTCVETGKYERRSIIYLWDLKEDRKVCSWEPEMRPGALLFSPEGDKLYAGCADRVLELAWSQNTASIREIPARFRVGKYRREIRMDISMDGQYLLMHGDMGTEVIDLHREGERYTAAYGLQACDGAFVPLSDMYFCACTDGIIIPEEAGKGELFRFRDDDIPNEIDETRIAVSPLGDMLAVSTKRNGVALYDLEWNYEF